MPAARRQLWLVALIFLVAGGVICVGYLWLRASSIQLAQGRMAYDAGRYDLAEDAYVRAVTLAPNSAEAWYWLGISRKNQGKSKLAAEALEQAVTLKPRNASWQFECAEALQWAEQFAKAEQAWRRLLDMIPADDPRAIKGRLNLAKCLAAQGQLDRAVQMLQEMLAQKDDRNVRFVLAEILAYAGRLEESTEQWRRAFGSPPESKPEK